MYCAYFIIHCDMIYLSSDLGLIQLYVFENKKTDSVSNDWEPDYTGGAVCF